MVLSVFIFILYAVTSIIYILYSEWGGGTEKKIGFHFGLKKYFGFELGSKDFRVCLSALCMHPLLNAKQMFGDSHHTTKLFWVSIFQKNMGLTKTLHTPHTHIYNINWLLHYFSVVQTTLMFCQLTTGQQMKQILYLWVIYLCKKYYTLYISEVISESSASQHIRPLYTCSRVKSSSRIVCRNRV